MLNASARHLTDEGQARILVVDDEPSITETLPSSSARAAMR